MRTLIEDVGSDRPVMDRYDEHHPMDQQVVLDNVQRWAAADPNIRLVVLTGSVARGPAATDALSDIDVELYVVDPGRLLDHRDWYQRFGQVLVVEELENPDWSPTRLVYYIDGKIDFMVAPMETATHGIEYDGPYRVLVDKDGLSKHLNQPSKPPSPPSEVEFSRCVNWFYAAALMYAKCMVRDEPWMAKFRDADLKTELLEMIAWDHKSRYGWDYDTGHNGSHMREWMDPDVAAAAKECWADFSMESMKEALVASVALFDGLSTRTATAIGLEPFDSTSVREEIDRLISLSSAR
jgi:aminoglycoside 6-adenylyltransferase